MKQLIILLIGLFISISLSASCDLAPKFGYATKGMTAKFNNKSKGNITSYLWTFGDGTTSEEENPEHIYETGGMYAFSLTVSNEEGCSETFEGKIYIFKLQNPTTTPDHEEVEEEQPTESEATEDVVTLEESTEDLATEDPEVVKHHTVVVAANSRTVSAKTASTWNSLAPVKVVKNYPNPFTNQTTIEFDLAKSTTVQVQVFDLSGKMVSVLADEEMNSGLHQLPFERGNLPNGQYIAAVVTPEKTWTTQMMIQ